MTVLAKLDLALRLLDELDETPLGQVNAKLDRITDAVAAAKRELPDAALAKATPGKLTDDEIVELTSREAAFGPDKAGGAV